MASARRSSKAHRFQRDAAWTRFMRELKKRPALLTLGGLALGAVAVGVCLLLLHFVIQPFSRPEAKGYTTFQGESFRLWYDDESTNMEDHVAMQEALEREYADLITLMGIREAVFEDPIDVFIHDSIPAMQMSIMRRKSSTAGAVFDYPFDVLADQSPRRALAEVMLFYEWGGCFTSALYAGTLEYITAPEVPYLSIVKAAPDEMTHSLEELAVMESRGEFGTTMYRELSGPMASAAIVDLASFQVLLRVPQSLAEAQDERFPVFEMASLVEFLVEQRGGMSRLATAWGPGQLSSVLQRADAASSLDELGALWQEAIETTGDVASVSPLRRVELLLEGGFTERAYEMIQTWGPDLATHTQEECAVAARCLLAVGAFDEAARWVETLDERIRGEYEQLLQLFAGWGRRETDELVLVAPAALLDAAFDRVEAGYRAMCDRTRTSLKEASNVRPMFFVYPDEASRANGAQLATANPTTRSAVHIRLDEDTEFAIVDLLLPRLWKWRPVSPLVRLGVVTALVVPRDELIEWATDLACAGDWRSISSISVSSASDHLLRTEVGLLIAQVEAIGGIEAVRAIWTAGRERGRISLESTLQMVVGSSTREIEQHILYDVIECP